MTLDELRASGSATISVRDAAELLGVDPRTVTSELSTNGGSLRAVRVGRRVVIPRVAFLTWLEGRADRADEIVPASSSAVDPVAIVRAKLVEFLGELESMQLLADTRSGSQSGRGA